MHRPAYPANNPTDRSTLIQLLEKTAEDDHWDFKEGLGDLGDNRTRAELTKDLLAFSNIENGGHLVFGVEDKTFNPKGLPADFDLDRTKLHNAYSKYTDAHIKLGIEKHWVKGSEVTRCPWSGERLFCIVYIYPYESIAISPATRPAP